MRALYPFYIGAALLSGDERCVHLGPRDVVAVVTELSSRGAGLNQLSVSVCLRSVLEKNSFLTSRGYRKKPVNLRTKLGHHHEKHSITMAPVAVPLSRKPLKFLEAPSSVGTVVILKDVLLFCSPKCLRLVDEKGSKTRPPRVFPLASSPSV